jgi:hypothetical protein
MATEIQGYYDDGTVVVSFDADHIDTTVTNFGSVVEWWLGETYRLHGRGGHIAGLDVEWRPARVPGPVVPPVAVLQICVDHRCLVFQILRADYVPDALSRFLADHRFTFVGVGIGDDVAKLGAGYGLWVASAVDLREFGRRHAGEASAAPRGAAGARVGGDGLADAEAAPRPRQRLGRARAVGRPGEVCLRRRVRLVRGRPEALRRRLLGYTVR